MGNPAIGDEERISVREQFRGTELSPLPEAERQVETLGKMYGPNKSDVYVGDAASEERFKTDYGIEELVDAQ